MMDVALFSLAELFQGLALPLGRLLLTMSAGLLAASLVEAMNWTRAMSRIASPLVRAGRLSSEAGASFALAFFSPSTANAFLADAYAQRKIGRLELVLSNLFNSSPAYLVHLPTVFSLAWAFLGKHAFVYVGLTFCAASLRTLGTLAAARLCLPQRAEAKVRSGKHVGDTGMQIHGSALPSGRQEPRRDWKGAFSKGFYNWKKRLLKLFVFTIPIYCLIYAAQKAGWFVMAEDALASRLSFLTVMPAEAAGIVVLNLAAESGAAFSAAASLMQGHALETSIIIMSLLVGNILSSPMRAIRHQFPAYAGYFGPCLAARLVFISQSCRIVSLALMTWLYWLVVS